MSVTAVGAAPILRGRSPAIGEQVVSLDDEDFVREIYEASYRRLVVQVFAVVGDRLEAEDAVQEAFARAVAAGARFRRTENPEAWVRVVALNVVRRRWRRTRMFHALSPRIASASTVPEASPDHVALVRALLALPVSQREVLALFYFGDLSVGEIAETLGIAPGTVKSRLSRGREALAASPALAPEGDHG